MSEVMDKKALKALAADLYSGKAISSLTLNFEEMDIVFMMMQLFKWDKTREAQKDLGCIYGYVKDAAPSSINGLPVLFAWRFLNKKDTKKLIKYFNKIIKKMRKFDGKKTDGPYE